MPDGAGIAEVRAYDVDGRLLGSAVPDGGLVPPDLTGRSGDSIARSGRRSGKS